MTALQHLLQVCAAAACVGGAMLGATAAMPPEPPPVDSSTVGTVWYDGTPAPAYGVAPGLPQGEVVMPHPSACRCCNEEKGFCGKLWDKMRPKARDHYISSQHNRALHHPECPPYCMPNFGHYQTCWRQFPEQTLGCRACFGTPSPYATLPALHSGHSGPTMAPPAPAPAAEMMLPSGPTVIPRSEYKFPPGTEPQPALQPDVVEPPVPDAVEPPAAPIPADPFGGSAQPIGFEREQFEPIPFQQDQVQPDQVQPRQFQPDQIQQSQIQHDSWINDPADFAPQPAAPLSYRRAGSTSPTITARPHQVTPIGFDAIDATSGY